MIWNSNTPTEFDNSDSCPLRQKVCRWQTVSVLQKWIVSPSRTYTFNSILITAKGVLNSGLLISLPSSQPTKRLPDSLAKYNAATTQMEISLSVTVGAGFKHFPIFGPVGHLLKNSCYTQKPTSRDVFCERFASMLRYWQCVEIQDWSMPNILIFGQTWKIDL